MDLHEDTEKNVVTAAFELPGVPKDAVQLDVHDGRLTVSAEATLGGELAEDGFAVRERRLGRFARTLQLPLGVKVRTSLLMILMRCTNGYLGRRY